MYLQYETRYVFLYLVEDSLEIVFTSVLPSQMSNWFKKCTVFGPYRTIERWKIAVNQRHFFNYTWSNKSRSTFSITRKKKRFKLFLNYEGMYLPAAAFVIRHTPFGCF